MKIAEKKQRAAIEEAMMQTAAAIKDCGKAFIVTFDWEAFDAIDWATIGRDKLEYYSSELNNVVSLGDGVNRLCADPDYKEALASYSTIVYRSTNDDSIALRASVSGTTVTFDNYTFGSTRGPSDYEAALKAVI